MSPAPSTAAAMPASFGNAVKAPAASLMPARASGSIWLRAFDLKIAGMPKRVASRICWIALVKVATWKGVTLLVFAAGVGVTRLRRMKRLICWLPM